MPDGKFYGGPWDGEVHHVPDDLHASGHLLVPWPVRSGNWLAEPLPSAPMPRQPARYVREALPTLQRADDPTPWHLQ